MRKESMKYPLRAILILLFISLFSCAQLNDIHWNATFGYHGTVERLLDEGVDVNSRDKDGKTPLIPASCSPKAYRTVQVLLARGADVNAQDNKGVSSLMAAAMCNNPATAYELISHGADINARTSYGATALVFAAQKGSEGIVKMLLNEGAGEDLKSVHFALKAAEKEGHANIYGLLWDEYAAAWYVAKMKAIIEGNDTSEYKHAVGVFLVGFFNNENTEEFSPDTIDYVKIDSGNVYTLLDKELTKDGILMVRLSSLLEKYELSGPRSEKKVEKAGNFLSLTSSILSIIDEYIQTNNFDETKAVDLTFPLLVDSEPDKFQWDENFPIYLVVGLETQIHDKPAHVLGSCLGIVRFSGKGEYTAMGIIPYDFSNITDSIYADKILSFISPFISPAENQPGTEVGP